MQLGLTWGDWGRSMPDDFVEVTKAAEDAGFDVVFAAESWGSDGFAPLELLAAQTEGIKLGTKVVQISARTAAATAAQAVALDEIASGRVILGVGDSDSPARGREYVEVLRQGFRHEIPTWIAATGPKNVAQACEIADGWFPLYYSPWRAEVYHDQIKDRPVGFEISVNVTMQVTDDVTAALERVREGVALSVGARSIGGMGAKGLIARMGFEDAAHQIHHLLLDGHRDEAIAAVPIEFADELCLVGSIDRIKDRLQAWEESAVTMINVRPRSIPDLREIAELVKS